MNVKGYCEWPSSMTCAISSSDSRISKRFASSCVDVGGLMRGC